MEDTPLQKISFLVLRAMGSLIFITAGFNHFLNAAGAGARLQKASLSYLATWIAPADTLIILSGIGLLIGGFMLLAGFQTRLSALLLLLILLPITLTVQLANPEGAGPLFKNVALIGMLLFFAANGARYYSIDRALKMNTRVARKTDLNPPKAGSFVAVLATGLVLLIGSCTTPERVAQAATQQGAAVSKKNYAVLISQPNHLRAAVNTAETITANSPYNRESFVVMACARSVEAFVKGGDMEAEFKKGLAAGITYKVCGMSLRQFNIDPGTLVEGVEVEPNGLTYMFGLQQQGYITVEL